MTDGLVLDIDLTGLEAAVAELESFPALLGRELTTAMESSLQTLEREVASRTPVNTGQLRSSIGHSIVSPFPDLVGQVGTPKEYGIVMEYGRKPGSRMPPVDAIQYWVVRKLQLSADEAESAAWAIAKSIAKKGIEGRHMFEEGLKVAEPTIQKIFNNAAGRATAQVNE